MAYHERPPDGIDLSFMADKGPSERQRYFGLVKEGRPVRESEVAYTRPAIESLWKTGDVVKQLTFDEAGTIDVLVYKASHPSYERTTTEPATTAVHPGR